MFEGFFGQILFASELFNHQVIKLVMFMNIDPIATMYFWLDTCSFHRSLCIVYEYETSLPLFYSVVDHTTSVEVNFDRAAACMVDVPGDRCVIAFFSPQPMLKMRSLPESAEKH
jgi:hypothetical protein